MKRKHLSKFVFFFGIFLSLFLIFASSFVSLNDISLISAAADECTHSSYHIISSTTASCTTAGTTVYQCDSCGYTWTTTTAAYGHNYKLDESKSGNDINYYKCTRCGDIYTVAHTHTYSYVYCDKNGDISNPIEPTCTTQGYKIEVCECGATSGDVVTVSKTGHTWIEDTSQYKAPTCTETGERHFSCSVCGETKVTYPSSTGHNYEEQSDGTYKCSDCGATLSSPISAVITLYKEVFWGEEQYVKYLFIVMGSGITIWGLYLGVSFAIATDDEAKKKVKRRLMNLVVGVVVIVALILIAIPIITAIASFAG